jgi:hypothetical protein
MNELDGPALLALRVQRGSLQVFYFATPATSNQKPGDDVSPKVSSELRPHFLFSDHDSINSKNVFSNLYS